MQVTQTFANSVLPFPGGPLSKIPERNTSTSRQRFGYRAGHWEKQCTTKNESSESSMKKNISHQTRTSFSSTGCQIRQPESYSSWFSRRRQFVISSTSASNRYVVPRQTRNIRRSLRRSALVRRRHCAYATTAERRPFISERICNDDYKQ